MWPFKSEHAHNELKRGRQRPRLTDQFEPTRPHCQGLECRVELRESDTGEVKQRSRDQNKWSPLKQHLSVIASVELFREMFAVPCTKQLG